MLSIFGIDQFLNKSGQHVRVERNFEPQFIQFLLDDGTGMDRVLYQRNITLFLAILGVFLEYLIFNLFTIITSYLPVTVFLFSKLSTNKIPSLRLIHCFDYTLYSDVY